VASGTIGDQGQDRPVTLPGVAQQPKRSQDRTFKWIAVAAAACLVGFVVFVIVRGSPHPSAVDSAALEAPPPPLLRAGTMAPTFSLPALQGSSPVSLVSFRGKPVIVNFFASWCRDCRAELDSVARVAQATSGRLTVIGVDSNETSTATARQLLEAAGATYPIAVDAQAKVASQYLVQALPVTYFLNRSGQVVGTALGPQSVTSLEHWVVRLGVAK
jgi:cytochrome c biogenesis protein CcmG/thiol:disulfide interchange protein DsbE